MEFTYSDFIVLGYLFFLFNWFFLLVLFLFIGPLFAIMGFYCVLFNLIM